MEFKAWPKTPRLFRDIVITEKIDGTNACVVIVEVPTDIPVPDLPDDAIDYVSYGCARYLVGAQSRNRMITPAKDNAGFAVWVERNAGGLVEILGPGYHYGEWWGSGIQRNYGMNHKTFSLFNTHKWEDVELSDVPGLGVVPKLYQGPFDEDIIEDALSQLKWFGSQAAPEFMDPEGIIVYHSASRQTFKVTLDNDGHKGAAI
jgi:hypothetical protein